MTCRGIRGATTAHANTEIAIFDATEELLRLVAANELRPADIASAVFTVTPDLTAAFPALRRPRARLASGAAARHGRDCRPRARPPLHPCPDPLEYRPARLRHPPRLSARGRRCAPTCSRRAASSPCRLRPDAGTPRRRPRQAAAVPADHVVPSRASRAPTRRRRSTSTSARRSARCACHSFEDIFQAVEEGRATLGLLPVENSQAGSINQAYDLLLDHDLRVVGEVKLRVRHCLLRRAGHDSRPTSAACARIRRRWPSASATCATAAGSRCRPTTRPAPPRELAAQPGAGHGGHRQRAGRPDLRAGGAGRRHRGLAGQHDPLLPARPRGAAARQAQQDLHRLRHAAHAGRARTTPWASSPAAAST